jgi:DNA-directed RNA polymerase subunit K/omega
LCAGYEWVGWKNRSTGPLQLDFTFDTVRVFSKMAIHINNHYSRDIQIFARAKVRSESCTFYITIFSKMAIHINNHYSRDIQIFARAKVRSES